MRRVRVCLLRTTLTWHRRVTAPVATRGCRGYSVMMESKDRSYVAAKECLFSLQSNVSVIQAWKESRATNKRVDLRDEMLHHLQVVGAPPECLSVIHVAGTKGKGSTCMFAERVLRHRGYKTGVFTSPHLIEPRERLRINGRPLSEQLFARYFWQTYDALSSAKSSEYPLLPPFFRFLTVMSFVVFKEECVDVSILEVGIGGRADSTNVVKPLVCGITRLGYDHMNVLGSTLEEIAWEKGGICKPGTPVFTCEQQAGALRVLHSRAEEQASLLTLVPKLPCGGEEDRLSMQGEHQRVNATLGLALAHCWSERHENGNGAKRDVTDGVGGGGGGDDVVTVGGRSLVQPLSLSEQTALATKVLQWVSNPDKDTLSAIRSIQWCGRCQVIPFPSALWRDPALQHPPSSPVDSRSGEPALLYLDGAHTPESMNACAEWWESTCLHASANAAHAAASSTPGTSGVSGDGGGGDSMRMLRVLVFNCNKGKDAPALLARLARIRVPFDHVVICPSHVSVETRVVKATDPPAMDLTWQHHLASLWSSAVAAACSTTPSSSTVHHGDKSCSGIPLDEASATGQHAVAVVHDSVGSALRHIVALHEEPMGRVCHMGVLATGSLYLVGAMLQAAQYPVDDL